MIRHRLIRPPGFTADGTRHVALALAGVAAGTGGGPQELAEVLRATGLLYDPEQKSPAHLGDERTHPYGRRGQEVKR